MIEITAEIRALIDKAAAGVELAGDEYIDPADGLIHCKKCGGQRQTVVPCFGKPGYFMPRCICQCQQEAEEQRKAAEERQRRMERIKRRKAQGLQDRYLYDYTFANDNGQNPLMDKARAYVENWKEAYKSNIGLLLFGDVGTGKSFFAGCIANALLDRDVPVLMTNFPTILNRLTGMFSEDRADFIASFDEYDLLIIDDLGVERSTEYAMEQMFFVIDSRYRSRRPMIITTNLKLAELKNPPDLAHARIYDRILERCAPILFDGKNFREENAGATRQTAKEIVNSITAAYIGKDSEEQERIRENMRDAYGVRSDGSHGDNLKYLQENNRENLVKLSTDIDDYVRRVFRKVIAVENLNYNNTSEEKARVRKYFSDLAKTVYPE